MHDKVILDSCIIAAIFLPEPITSKAIDITAEHTCITIDLAYTEVANAAWKRALYTDTDPKSVQLFLDNGITYRGNV